MDQRAVCIGQRQVRFVWEAAGRPAEGCARGPQDTAEQVGAGGQRSVSDGASGSGELAVVVPQVQHAEAGPVIVARQKGFAKR
jgi:hypothetical protein